MNEQKTTTPVSNRKIMSDSKYITFLFVDANTLHGYVLSNLWGLSPCKHEDGPAYDFYVPLFYLVSLQEDIRNDDNKHEHYLLLQNTLDQYIRILKEKNLRGIFVSYE